MSPPSLLINVHLGGPTGPRSQCAVQCNEQTHFAYQTGVSYEYNYEVSTSTGLLGTFDENSDLHISAKAHIDVTAPCEFTLRLSSLSIDGSSSSEEFASALSANPLRFSFQDGQVETLCSEVSESEWVLNFKRGVLSTFQTTTVTQGIKKVQETDISGECSTTYTIAAIGSDLLIGKVKDMASCSRRPSLAHMGSAAYMTDSPIQNLPIMNSEQSCEQTIEENILTSAVCEESHQFRPFSSEKGGAVTTTKSAMTYIQREALSVVVTDKEYVQSSLIFNHPEHLNEEIALENIKNILDQLDATSHKEIKRETPVLFSSLVVGLQGLSYPQISSLYTETQEIHIRKFLIDAMPLVNTAAAVATVRDMINNGDMTSEDANAYFTSLAFIKYPTSDMFAALAPVLQENPSKNAMLGVSALLNNYCNTNKNCGDNSGIQQLLRNIESHLGSACRAIKDEEKMTVLIALKALGNAGRMANAQSILRRCYTEENDMEIRIAAIEAWRHTPCDYDRSHLLAAFQDENQDSEIRIAAYLSAMTCPTSDLIETIKDRLTSEGVNQVGSFVWTHMTNLQESAAPNKQWVRELIGEELLQKKFNTEALKFSRNYESSFFTNELNIGSAVESNIIFSSKSFLPRSAMLNLTLSLFGESINFFEVGGRIEGFEQIVEKFFGPNGFYPEETVEAIIKGIRQQKNSNEETTLESFLDKMTDEPEGSYYLKVFGNELYYNHFYGLDDMMKGSGFTNPLQFLMELARKGDVDYTKSYQLLDSHLVFPTITGLPVALNIKGSATVAMRMSGNFNVRSLKNINVEGHFHPSAALKIDSSMIVDAHVTRSGMKMVSSMYTSSYVDGKIQVKGGKLVDIQINTPKEKMEVIDVKTEFFHVKDNEVSKVETEDTRTSISCTSVIPGMKVCNEMSYTRSSDESPKFPLSGPVAAHIYLENTDSHSGYIFNFNSKSNQFNILFDAPGSNIDRKLSLSLTKKTKEVEIDVYTPFKAFKAIGSYEWHNNNKNAKLDITADGKDQYNAVIALQTTGNKMEPSLLITSPEGEVLSIAAGLQLDKQADFLASKLNIDYSFMESTKHSINHSAMYKKEISGDITTYTTTFSVVSSEYPGLNLLQDTQVQIAPGHYVSTAKLNYGLVEWSAEQIFKYDIKESEKNFDVKLMIHLSSDKELTSHLELSGFRDIELSGKAAYSCSLFGEKTMTNIEGAVTKISSGHYNVKVITDINSNMKVLEGTLENKSEIGKFDVVFDGSYKCNANDVKITSTIFADKTKANLHSTVDYNGQAYTFVFEGTRSSLLIDANIIRHIVLNADVSLTSESKSLELSAEWNKDVDPTEAFKIGAQWGMDKIQSEFKYKLMEAAFVGKVVNNGVYLEGSWDKNKKVTTQVNYSFADQMNLNVIITTPFPGFEKQAAEIVFTLSKYDVRSTMSATWNNIEQFSFNLLTKLEPAASNNKFNCNISFNSIFENFEQIKFIIDHTMTIDGSIVSKLNGKFNDKEITGKLHFLHEKDNAEMDVSFTTPVTNDLFISLRHKLQSKDLTTTLEGRYGAEVSTASLKGHFDLAEGHDITFVFKFDTPISALPKISSNINYKYDGAKLDFISDAKFDDKKIMLTVNGMTTFTESSANLSGDLRFITPFTYPINIKGSYQKDEQTFTSDLEMDRFWSTSKYGTLKVHANGKIVSKNDISVIAEITSPVLKSKAHVQHILQNNKLNSELSVAVNDESFTIGANGIFESSQLVNMEAKLQTSFEGLEDLKIKIDHSLNEDTYNTNVVLMKDFVLISNIIGTLDINDGIFTIYYMQHNDQMITTLKHDRELEIVWGINTLHATANLNQDHTVSYEEYDFTSTLQTPWLENIRIESNARNEIAESEELNIKHTIEYASQKLIEYTCKADRSKQYIKHTLITPFFDTIALEMEFNLDIPYLTFVYGSYSTTLKINKFEYVSNSLDSKFTIETNYLDQPIGVEVAFNISSSEKSVRLAYICSHKCEFRGTVSGDIKTAKWNFSVDLPFHSVQNLGFSGMYNISNMPFILKTTVSKNSDVYEFNGSFDKNEISAEYALNGTGAKMGASWHIESQLGDVNVSYQWSDNDKKDLTAKYDLEKTRVSLSFTDVFNLSLKLVDGVVMFDGTTAIAGWEKLQGSAYTSESAFNMFASRNKRKIELTGTKHIKKGKGQISLTITTPYTGYETIAVDIKYSLAMPTKKVEFKSVMGKKELSVNGVGKFGNLLTPELSLKVVTPFNGVEKLGGQALYNFNDATKSVDVQAYYNDLQYMWHLESTSDSVLKGSAMTKINSPINGWTSVIVAGKFDFTSAPYTTSFSYDIEGNTNEFAGTFNMDDKSFNVELKTPVTDWEKVSLSGSYTLVDNELNGKVNIQKSSGTYNLKGNVNFNSQAPSFKVEIETPIEGASNIEVDLSVNMSGKVKAFSFNLISDSMRYTLQFNGNFNSKNSNVKVHAKTPISSFRTLEFNGNYDFTKDVKTAEITIIKEEKKQHFAIEAKLNNNKFDINIVTPFEGFENVKVNGDYTRSGTEYNTVATLERNDIKYSFHGVLSDDSSASLKISTPFEEMKTASFGGKYSLSNKGMEGSCFFENNSNKLEINTKSVFTPTKSFFNIQAKTPISGWKKLAMKVNYDIESTKKTAEITIQKGTITKTLSLEASFNLISGSFKVATPIERFESMGAEYTLNVEQDKVDASLTILKNKSEWKFTANGKFNEENVLIEFQTPFEGFNTVVVNGEHIISAKTVKGLIQFGDYSFTFDMQYESDNMLIKLTTPFDIIKVLSLSTKYNLSPSMTVGSISAIYNEQIYDLTASFSLSAPSSEILLNMNVPLMKTSFTAKYDLNNSDEIVYLSGNLNKDVYLFTAGANYSNNIAVFNSVIKSPIVGWQDVKINANTDLTKDDKTFKITMERDGDMKAIAISGKFIGELMHFKLDSPFKNLDIFGSLDRERRSVDFNMMSDDASAGIYASFNSVKLDVKSNYEKARDITWEISRSKKGNYKFEWKRNENYITFDVTQEKKNTISLTLNGIFEAWPILALRGELNPSEVEAYLSGQINEAKSSLKGSGKFATKKGSMEITLETPYDNYKKVETTMSYNRASKSFELKSKSSSSDFAIEIEFKGKLKIHLMVPNAVKPTHLHVEIEPFKGKIHFESRFSLEEFMYTYEVKIVQAKITVDMSTKINGVEKFRLALERDGQKNTGHLEVDLKAINNHELRFHREGFSVITASYKRNSDEIKFDITGSGNLPTKGKLNINVNNTFREPDRTMTIRMDVDRSSAQKSVKIEVEPQPRKLYIVDLTYTATLRNMNTGNWEMKITTPERRNYPWSSTKGNWDFRNPNDSQLEFSMGPKKYTAKGQFGLRESKLVLSSGSGGPNIHLEWKFQRNFDDRDYYLKIGPESRYLLFKLKGTITDIANAYIEGAFRGPLFMTETFTYDSRWSRDASGDVSGSGSFKYGNKEGRHELKMFHRDASTKSAEFSFEATSNIPNFNKLIIKGEYNFNNRAHIDIKIEWDTDNISFKFDIADFNPEYSNNTASLHAPSLGDVELTFGHDFRNRKAKSITAVAKFGANESSVKAEWNRSDDFDTLTGKVVVKSIFLGDIEINFDFDVSNLKDAKAAFNYKRNNSKNVSVNWVRKLTADSLHTEVNFQSHFKTIPSARFYVDVNFKKGLKVDAGIEYSKKITIQLNLGDSKATGKIETPFRGFEKMESEIEYNLKGKQKTVTGRYTRGNNKVSLDINLNMKSKKEGSFNLKLTTPFDAVKNFEVTAAIKNKKADVTYVRNDVTYQFNGKADIKSDKSSIDISFTPSGKSPIKIAAAYDLASIIRGNGNAPQTLLRMKLEFDDLKLESELKGFRNNDRVFIELDVKKSFGLFHNMHLLMDSELNATNRDGSFEFSFDEHTFKAKNHFERKANNGYYFKTEMESSLTPLPALIIGFGRENEERTVTIGYGNGNEITASFKPKENFRKGFYAMVDIPKYNVYNIKCDVEYGFERNNAVFVEADIEFDNGKKVEAKLLYTSEGVKARLSSPFTGKRSIRVLRSITDKSFQAEAGIDDYSMKLRGGFSDDKKNGFNIEGEIFGKKFLIDALVQNEGKQYAEGKLLIETPIYGLHKMGGFFTWSNMDGKILAKSEVIMPTLLMNNPKISAEVNLDLNKKINGAITLNIAGEVFALKSNIIKTTQKGYEGSLELYSPFHALSEVDIRGGIKMESFTNIESNLNIKT
ncbi:unnamed protein product, partial [Meganyctiphanes norvegica]